ncbi:hypothetical protein Trydic_g12749 [Trypoxylus dichotomus]
MKNALFKPLSIRGKTVSSRAPAGRTIFLLQSRDDKLSGTLSLIAFVDAARSCILKKGDFSVERTGEKRNTANGNARSEKDKE